jgi:hypothetical protein
LFLRGAIVAIEPAKRACVFASSRIVSANMAIGAGSDHVSDTLFLLDVPDHIRNYRCSRKLLQARNEHAKTGAANAMEPGFPSRRSDLCDIEIPCISRVLGGIYEPIPRMGARLDHRNRRR